MVLVVAVRVGMRRGCPPAGRQGHRWLAGATASSFCSAWRGETKSQSAASLHKVCVRVCVCVWVGGWVCESERPFCSCQMLLTVCASAFIFDAAAAVAGAAVEAAVVRVW